jgi:hypothetical protein
MLLFIEIDTKSVMLNLIQYHNDVTFKVYIMKYSH